jgi:hypothetical protein
MSYVHLQVEFGPSEFLEQISGTTAMHTYYGEIVTSLSFVTNTGNYGPFGETLGNHFCSPVQNNCSIVGFFVNATNYIIYSVGLYVDMTGAVVCLLLSVICFLNNHLFRLNHIFFDIFHEILSLFICTLVFYYHKLINRIYLLLFYLETVFHFAYCNLSLHGQIY